MSRANREKYLQDFKAADLDGSGKISKEELRKLLDKLGKQNTDVDRAFARLDEDNSGYLNEAEFLIFMEDVDNAWVRVQAKTFTRWADKVLSTRMKKCQSILLDLKTGILLAELIEILAKKPVGKMNVGKMRVARCENIAKCLTFLQNDHVKLVNIGPDDIEDGNTKITLGLVWTLILRYQFNDGLEEGSPKYNLLQWVKQQCAPYGIGQDLRNFKDGWSDGKVLSALTDSLGEKFATIDTNHLSGDAYEDTKNAMDKAWANFEIAKLMDAEDIVENPDEHSIMTYVGQFRDFAANASLRPIAGNTTASGRGITGDDSGTFEGDILVTTRNQQNQPCNAGGAPIDISVRGPNGPLACELKDGADGTYSGAYPVEGPGDYVVDINLKGSPIKGSPFTAKFRQGDAGQCYAEGDGLSKGKTNRPSGFNIVSVGANGKHVPLGGDPFVVSIDGPSGRVNADVQDNGTGVYPVKYCPNQEGKYNIAVTLFGENIKGSPFTAHVKRAPNAAKSFVEGPGLKNAYDNKPTHFNLHAIDDLGSPVSGDLATVTMAPADPASDLKEVEVAVVDQGNGIYRCDYSAPQAGEFIINVALDGQPVQGTPVKIKVRVGGDASKSGGAKFQVTIVSRDKHGDAKKEGGDDWEVHIDAHGHPDVHIDVSTKDNGDGTYSANYKLPSSEGEPVEYHVHMSLNGDALKGSPFKQYM